MGKCLKGLFVEVLGSIHCDIKLHDGSIWKRHIEQLWKNIDDCEAQAVPNVPNVSSHSVPVVSLPSCVQKQSEVSIPSVTNDGNENIVTSRSDEVPNANSNVQESGQNE